MGHRQLRRIALTDRPWMGHRQTMSIGPVASPDPEDIRVALRLLADRHPEHPLVCRFDPTGWWRPVPADEIEEHVRAVVVPVEAHVDAATVEDLLPGWLADTDASLPVRILVTPTSLTIVAHHALGDGRTTVALLEALVRSRTDPGALLSMVGPSSDRATLTALVDFYGRRPWRVVRTLRHPRATPVAGVVAAAPPVGGPPALVYGRIDREQWAAMRRRRDEEHQGASMAAVVISMTCQVLGAASLGIDTTGFFLLVDNRRYIRGSAPLMGNMAKSVYVRPPDVADVGAVQATVRETLESGRTLASTALSAVSSEWGRRRVRRGRKALGWAPGEDAILSFTYLNRVRALESFDWLDDRGDRWLTAYGSTGSSAGITVFAAELDGELHFSFVCPAGVLDAAQVRRAVDAMGDGFWMREVPRAEVDDLDRPGAVAAGL